MTILQAAALRMKWNMLPYASACEHRNLELEWDDLGYSTGKYVCIVCGESVVLHSKHPLLKRKSTVFIMTRGGKNHHKERERFVKRRGA
jgi:hypothetical protein